MATGKIHSFAQPRGCEHKPLIIRFSENYAVPQVESRNGYDQALARDAAQNVSE